MTPLPLAGRNTLVLGVERPAGRAVAVAFAEAGANAALVTLSDEKSALFAANSTGNEFWALDRKCVVLSMGSEHSQVIAQATASLGPISIAAINVSQPLARESLAGLRSDPAIIVIIETNALDAAVLLEWTRDLAASGLRANALVASLEVLPDKPCLKQHHPPEPMHVAAAAVYLASDATAAIEGTMVVAVEP